VPNDNVRSKCCDAPVKIKGGTFGDTDSTWYYVCTKCNEPCDPVFKSKEIQVGLKIGIPVNEVLSKDKLFPKLDSSIAKPMTRPTWDTYFMDMAKLVATRSTCLRRQVGCVIVKHKRVLATGYNGAPDKIKHCIEMGGCFREQHDIPSGHRQELCAAVHAEENAIAQAAKFGIKICGSDLYITNLPCITCAKLIIQCGITSVIYDQEYPDIATTQLFKEAGIVLINYNL
jgi:dCMP deaminase